MTLKQSALLLGAVALLAAFVTRSWFPATVTVRTPPRIVTVHDTVATLDTTWVTRLVHDTVHTPAPPPEQITVTVVDTVYRVPPLTGVTAFSVAPRVGDSTLVAGFQVEPSDSGYTMRRWTAQYYTSGPIRAMVLGTDGFPRLTFTEPPPPPCRLLDRARDAGIGGGLTLLAYLFLHGSR